MRFPNESAPSTHDVEEAYWSILSLSKEHVCVLSAFIDTSVDSLGHPSDPAAPGGNHPWNLKVRWHFGKYQRSTELDMQTGKHEEADL